MKYNIHAIKKSEVVVFQGERDVTDAVGITELINDINDNRVPILILDGRPYIHVDFIKRKLNYETKKSMFALIDNDKILVDCHKFSNDIRYFLGMEEVEILIENSLEKDKTKHRDGLEYIATVGLEKHRKSVEFNVACKKLKIK